MRRSPCCGFSRNSEASIGYRKIHVARVIEDSAAVGAGHNFLFRLAGDDGRAAQLHVATSTDAMLDPDDHILALLLEQALIARTRAGINRFGELAAVGI